MRKILGLALAILLCISFCGCEALSSLMESVPELGEIFGGASDWGVEQENEWNMVEPEKTVVLPDFAYQSEAYATGWLSGVGISANVERIYSSDFTEGTVISQSIPAGSEIPVSTQIVLVVSLGAEPCPYAYSQKLTVTAPAGATKATAVLYAWQDGAWRQLAAYKASVGMNGLGAAQEGSRRTPTGIYRLGVVLSANSLQTNLSVRTVSGSTCVVDDTGSPYYNMIMETYQVPAGTSYDQIGWGLTNGTTYATIYIEHNGSGLSSEGVVPGKGSAIGLRGQYGGLNPTYGDVDISYTDMIDLLSRLDATKNPVIEIVVE